MSDRPTAADDATQGAGAKVQAAAGRLGEQASQLGSKVYGQAEEAGQYVSRQIQEDPLIVVAIAAATGLLVGFLLGRSTADLPSPRDYARAYARQNLPRRYRTF